MYPIVKIYKKLFIKRYDPQPHIKYFDHTDFPGLCKEDISFVSAQGDTLKGGIYNYDVFDNSILVIFCHGIGCGHLSYMREIELLCKNGYRVLAYDNTGCADSSGVDIRGMAQSLSDLDSCFEYISKNDRLADKRIMLIGHSWGGYAVGNILNYRSNIEKAVILSGFVSVELLLKQYFKGIAKPLLKFLMRYERSMNGHYADSISAVGYEKTTADVLVIHSDDDPIVDPKLSVEYLKGHVKGTNVRYIITPNRKHNPNYTDDAVDYLNERFNALNNAIKQKKVKTEDDKKEFFRDVDWYRMTEQDACLWSDIIKFMKGDL